MQKLERFVVITYSKECGLAKANEARHSIFTSGKKTVEHIPPSQVALFDQESAASGQFLLESSNLSSPRNPGFPRIGVAKGIQWYLVALLDNIPKCQ